ncbi:(2Fe-2S)-binding protein [Rhodococcus jostii]|uniref:(2Fe-2S)-binding protein n=1 Tax=Rhodococcus jostii TaxID=132919 RepID=UPI0036525778
MQVNMTVNGEAVSAEVEPRMLLVHFLRDQLGLTGTHWGCDTSNCGTCVVTVDGDPVKSCTMLAAMAGGHDVRTVEGLEHDGELDPVQQGFMQCHGLQCGFCTPGMMMTARALLDREESPDEATIREAISGQICRCTGYTTIVRSIQWAADHRVGEAAEPEPAGDFDADVQEDKTRGAEGAPMTVEEHATTGSAS